MWAQHVYEHYKLSCTLSLYGIIWEPYWSHLFSQVFGGFSSCIEHQGPWAVVTGAGAPGMLGGMILLHNQDALGVNGADTVIFEGTTLAGVVGVMLGAVRLADGIAAGGALGSFKAGVTCWGCDCMSGNMYHHHFGQWWGMSCADIMTVHQLQWATVFWHQTIQRQTVQNSKGLLLISLLSCVYALHCQQTVSSSRAHPLYNDK